MGIARGSNPLKKLAPHLPTASPMWVGMLCGASATAWLVFATEVGTITAGWTLLLALVCFACPGVIVEFRREHCASRRSHWRRPDQAMLRRSLVRCFGLAQILACGWLALQMFPEYDKDIYQFFREAYSKIYLGILLLSLPTFLLGEMAGRGRPQQDIHRYVGRFTLFTLLYRVWTKPILRQGILAYLVKMFFLPNMLGLSLYSISYISLNTLSSSWGDPNQVFYYVWNFVNLIDVLIAIVGYSLSLRLLNTQVVHVDPSWRGWVATCICYFPFSTALYASYLTYGDGIEWFTVLGETPSLLYLYGAVLLILHLSYMVSSLQFGIRFSNLSHKGILTDGLFRFTRHPAYLFKNIVWWLESVPFIYEGAWYVGASNCLILFGVNIVYWWRARTEEMHLSRDPLYVEYALMMNEKSCLAFLGKWFPGLAYKIPTAKLQYEYRISNLYQVG
jgi:hypothetical protein